MQESNNVYFYTHVFLHDQVFNSFHHKRRSLGHEFGEHGNSLGATTFVLTRHLRETSVKDKGILSYIFIIINWYIIFYF